MKLHNVWMHHFEFCNARSGLELFIARHKTSTYARMQMCAQCQNAREAAYKLRKIGANCVTIREGSSKGEVRHNLVFFQKLNFPLTGVWVLKFH